MTVVAISIFFIIWNSRAFRKNNYFLILGVAYLFVAGFDLLRALVCEEMGVHSVKGSNLGAQLWIASRYLESISLLAAPLMLDRKIKLADTFSAFLVISALILGWIFCRTTFPECHVEGVGPTAFRVVSECIICSILAVAMGLVLTRGDRFDEGVSRLLAASILFTICSQLAFTFLAGVSRVSNLLGHCFKIISLFLIYKAIFETAVHRPYDTLLGKLTKERQTLREVNEKLERRVEERTLQLRRADEKLVGNVLECRNADEDPKAWEERLRTLVESLPLGITLLRDGKRQYVNPALVHMFGYESEEEILRLRIPDLYTPESGEIVESLLTSELEGKSVPCRQQAKGMKKSGETFDVSILFVKTECQGSSAILSFVQDMSEENSLRLQLFRSQKMESLGTMTGGIAHDFNNLLTIIIGYAELLLASKTKKDSDYEDLKTIVSTAEKGADLVRRILTYSRKVEANPRPMDLNDSVKQFKKLLERTIPKMIDIELHLADDLNRVNADPAQVELVLLNLAVNAQHAMAEGGTFTLGTENIALGETRSESRFEGESGQYVVLTVSDTGHGMEKEILEHVFEPFYTTKEPGMGTGLGLATVYGIVTSHGGRILCHSEPGHGTTFTIYLPAIEHEAEPATRKREKTCRGGEETILLVDDEEFIRALGTKIFSQAGYDILTAETGRKALEIYHSENRDISLVILDLLMPGMGGKECLEELLKIDRKAKVVLISGLADNSLTEHCLQQGARAFVPKPFRATEMLTTVRRLLDER
ncbi:MAG: MASE3 domain-containing protein [Desulfomonilaceae bacterium]|nr:MASE3 domain-containing protein [Desulfomonilaceae bacterium]